MRGGAGGGGIAKGPIQLRKSAKKLRKIVGKSRENCEKTGVPQPNLPKHQGTTLLNKWLRMFLCQTWATGITITAGDPQYHHGMKREPKAADIVIQFVLPLRNSAAL